MDKDVTAFEAHMARLSDRVSQATNGRYYPNYWEQSRSEVGAVKAAKNLLAASDKPQDGLYKLWEFGILHLSVERELLKPEYSELFTDSELEEARKRLTDLDFTGF
jgi:hypothetical protein